MTLHQSQLHQYSSRDASLTQVSLRDFFANFTVNGNQVKCRVIVRTFPAYSSSVVGHSVNLLCTIIIII